MTRRRKAGGLALLIGAWLTATVVAQQSDDAAPPSAEETAAAIEAEDAEVEAVLSETDDIVYREDEGDEDFIPSQEVSSDQSLDYPIDI